MLNRLKIRDKIGAGFALGLEMLSLIGIASYRTTSELIANSRRESHTYQVLGHIRQLSLDVVNAETGSRGYLLTGQTPYLEPYNSANKALQERLQTLRKLTSDNFNQQRRLDILQALIEQRLARLKTGISIRQTQGFEAAQQYVLTNQGRQLMVEIRQVTQEMENEEYEFLAQRSQKAQTAAQATLNTIVYGIPVSFVILSVIGWGFSRTISKPLGEFSEVAKKISDGDLFISLPTSDREDEIGVLTHTFNQMIVNLRETIQAQDEQNWLQSNLAEISQQLQGRRNLEDVTRLALSYLAPLVGAQQGVFYVIESEADEPILKLLSSYAYQERKHLANKFRLGEGLVGQCALEKQRILLTQVPSDYIRISSGLGEAAPLNIVVLPILFENQLTGVIELASFQQFSPMHLNFLERVSLPIGIVINTIFADIQTQKLLEQTRLQAQVLQNQQSQLQETNQQLEEQAKTLRESELLLKKQQEELQHSNEELQQLNEELEEKAELLESQKQEVERQNQQIEKARQEVEDQAEQLTLSSQYKSEFLANMSHELRTPLNSLLILAKLLTDNAEGNLTDKQVEYSRTIFYAGTDLLELINDILDLAKIESGTLELEIEQLYLSDLKSNLERNFQLFAENKKLGFAVKLDENLPEIITTDAKRLQQILKNFLSNAFKFTEQGNVTLKIGVTPENMMTFAVSDTGIGIPADKQKIIFEAFQQADGSTSRKYGGTGLGLSISRELAQLLGGRITLVSQVGAGSTFTLYLPRTLGGHNQSTSTLSTPVVNKNIPAKLSPLSSSPTRLPTYTEIADDRDNIQPEDRVLLIIEDDDKFANILLEMAREQGFKVILALRSKQGLALAKEYQPDAITLDINMPEMDGWIVLDRLKRDSETRHIPVHIMSVDEREQQGLNLGAITFLQKPISKDTLIQTLSDIKKFIERKVKNLLVIEDDPVQANSIIELIGNGDVQSTAIGTGAEALSFLQSNRVDCVVLDLGLPDMSGFELIEQIKQNPNLVKIPIIVYTGKEISRSQETQLRRLAETIIIKDVRSPERLLDETALFLHRVQANLPRTKQKILEELRSSDPVLVNKKLLIIDDDVRNIFAITSLLEGYQMQVFFAENGRDGIEVLQENPDINVVLMDIMMPEMDGYETTRTIREQPKFKNLPIIALTAKAMQGDKEKCIEAGASDYITKPVDTEQLLSLLRVWLYR